MEIVLYGAITVVAAALFFASATLLRAGFTHVFTREDIRRDAEAHSTATAREVMRGEVDTYKRDDRRDGSVAAGMARDLKTGRYILQGRVSDEVLETLV